MLETLKLIIQLIPYILELLKAVEAAIPQSGAGKEKLAFVRETISTLYPQVLDSWPTIEKIISYAVNLFNSTGLFAKKG